MPILTHPEFATEIALAYGIGFGNLALGYCWIRDLVEAQSSGCRQELNRALAEREKSLDEWSDALKQHHEQLMEFSRELRARSRESQNL